MKLCVFSDIHGNTLYLDAVTNAWKDNTLFDRFYFLGDAVGYFFNGNQVLTKLRKMNAACVCGNHDAMLMGSLPLTEKKDEVYQLAETRKNISPENLEFIQTWPEILEESIDGLNIKFVHGTPELPLEGYGYENTAIADFDQPGLDTLFIGQTHRPWIHRNKHTTIVNVGSVGLPRDIGNSPSYVIFDTEKKQAEIHRLEVDPSPILIAPGLIHPCVLDVLRRT